MLKRDMNNMADEVVENGLEIHHSQLSGLFRRLSKVFEKLD